MPKRNQENANKSIKKKCLNKPQERQASLFVLRHIDGELSIYVEAWRTVRCVLVELLRIALQDKSLHHFASLIQSIFQGIPFECFTENTKTLLSHIPMRIPQSKPLSMLLYETPLGLISGIVLEFLLPSYHNAILEIPVGTHATISLAMLSINVSENYSTMVDYDLHNCFEHNTVPSPGSLNELIQASLGTNAHSLSSWYDFGLARIFVEERNRQNGNLAKSILTDSNITHEEFMENTWFSSCHLTCGNCEKIEKRRCIDCDRMHAGNLYLISRANFNVNYPHFEFLDVTWNDVSFLCLGDAVLWAQVVYALFKNAHIFRCAEFFRRSCLCGARIYGTFVKLFRIEETGWMQMTKLFYAFFFRFEPKGQTLLARQKSCPNYIGSVRAPICVD